MAKFARELRLTIGVVMGLVALGGEVGDSVDNRKLVVSENFKKLSCSGAYNWSASELLSAANNFVEVDGVVVYFCVVHVGALSFHFVVVWDAVLDVPEPKELKWIQKWILVCFRRMCLRFTSSAETLTTSGLQIVGQVPLIAYCAEADETANTTKQMTEKILIIDLAEKFEAN
jgi:hypothetical protein